MSADVETSKYTISSEYPGVEYFDDEVREGFFVSSMMKRYWAAQIKVLSEIDKVCRKYEIRWFADYGTLLGAVRHGGMIPWDDDMDICMLRKDWLRFFEVAKDELPENYGVLTLQSESEYENIIGRVVNSRAIDYSDSHLKEFFGCPYTVGVDIFPLDDLSNDEETEERRRKLASDAADAYEMIAAGKGDTQECRSLLAKIESDNHIILHRKGNILRELRLLTEKLYMMHTSDDAEYIALMPFWIQKHNHKYSKELYKDTLYLPFEYISIPVPARYEEVLRIEYGNYMAVRKGGGIHEYPVFKDQEELLKAKNRANPFRFTLTGHAVDSIPAKKTTEQKCFEITRLLLQVHDKTEALVKVGDNASVATLLNKCQTLAMSLGTLMENSMKGSFALVHMLEEYCELVYRASESWSNENRAELDEIILETEASVKDYFAHKKKEILFVSTKVEWWKELQPVYEYYVSLPDTQVYVMPISYIVTDKVLGTSGEIRNDGILLPEGLRLVNPEQYDISGRRPDVIVTSYPYDGWGATMDVPESFYSENLRSYTDELVYVPCYESELPINENDKAATAIRVMLEQPAVLLSDSIIVSSDEIRKCFADYLSERWKSKISGRKILVFGVDGSFLIEKRHRAVEKLKDAMQTIIEASEHVACIYSAGADVSGIETIDYELWKDYRTFYESISDSDNVIIDSDHMVKDCLSYISGYYGTPGVLAHRCRNLGKPVMLMNIF